MNPPPRILLAVLAVTAAAVAVGSAALLAASPQPTAYMLLVAALLGALSLLARRFPLHLTDKTKTSVATTPLFAAVLLLPLPLALITAALAIGAAEIWRRSRWFQALFNTGAGVLQLAAVGGVVAGLGGGVGAALAPSAWLGAALVGAVVFVLGGALLVELMVTVQLRRLVLRQFWQRTWLSLPQEGLLLLLGLLLALVTRHALWALPLLAAPVALVYRSLQVMARGLTPAATGATPAHLAQLPRRLQLVIVATAAAAALAGLAVALQSGGGWTVHSALLAAAAAGLAAIAYLLPVKPAPRRTLVLDAAFLLAAIIALPPTPALLSIAAASLLGNLLLRRPWFNTLFNAAQRTLAGLSGLLLLHVLAPTPLTQAVTLRGALGVAAAAVAYWLVSSTLVDLITAMQLRRSPFAHWWAAHAQSLLAHLLLLPTGALLAPALGRAPWLLPSLLLPALVVRALLYSAVRLEAQTSLLVTDLLLAAAERDPAVPTRAARLGTLCERLAAAYGLAPAPCRELGSIGRLAVLAEAQTAPLFAGPGNAGRRRALAALLEQADVAEVLAYRRTAYDGSTAASGPRGSAIPLGARILGLCEGWLRLADEQPTATTLSRLGALLVEAGTRWDPELVGLLAQLCRLAPTALAQAA